MIQTLVLANSIHPQHSQISMRILSLSLFNKFVEKGPVVFNAHLMSSSGWSWCRCLVLKIVISSNNSFRLCSCRLCNSFSCSAMQSTPQRTCSSGTSKGLRTQLNVLMWLWEGMYLSISERCSKVLKKDLTSAAQINFYLFCKYV